MRKAGGSSTPTRGQLLLVGVRRNRRPAGPRIRAIDDGMLC